MGRTKYSEKERKTIVATFIQAAQKIIDEQGIEGVSIRRVSSAAGYSSATLYLYFSDVSELTLMACVTYLEQYANELGPLIENTTDHREVYLRAWEVFCKHAFRRPQVFKHLFFSEHASCLDDIVKEYYSIYPMELDTAPGSACSLLLTGDLRRRALKELAPYASDLGLDEEERRLNVDLAVCYLRQLLEAACEKPVTPESISENTATCMRANNFLLVGAQASKG